MNECVKRPCEQAKGRRIVCPASPLALLHDISYVRFNTHICACDCCCRVGGCATALILLASRKTRRFAKLLDTATPRNGEGGERTGITLEKEIVHNRHPVLLQRAGDQSQRLVPTPPRLRLIRARRFVSAAQLPQWTLELSS